MQDLPTKEQINAITDIDALRLLETDINATCYKIEVDLTTIVDADEEWHSRARSALAYHRITLGNIRGRLRRLSKGNLDHLDQYAEAQKAKAAKKEATAKSKLAHNELVALSNDKKTIDAQNRRTALLERTCYLAAFRKAALQFIPVDKHDELFEAADEIYKKRLIHDSLLND